MKTQKKYPKKSYVLAEAALLLSQKIHEKFPEAVISPLELPYNGEDLTVDVGVSEERDLRVVADELIHFSLEIEDKHGISILAQASHASKERKYAVSP